MILSMIMQLRRFFKPILEVSLSIFQFVGSTTVQGDVKLIMTKKKKKR